VLQHITEYQADTENSSGIGPEYDPCPFMVDPASPLGKVHFMFAVLGLSHAWVVRRGKLHGVLTKKALLTNNI
jgi:hypothetical protein